MRHPFVIDANQGCETREEKEPDMPLRKAVVAAAVIKPGPSPVAKAGVVGAAVKPGPSPVAKAAVVGAVVKPGRRR